MPVSGCVADASTYAHYLFNAFDTTNNGSIKFEVKTKHHHYYSVDSLNQGRQLDSAVGRFLLEPKDGGTEHIYNLYTAN